MNKLRLILLTVVIVLFFSGSGICQQKIIWNITYTKASSGTQESLSMNPYALHAEGRFTGLLTVTLDVDSSTQQGDNDSLYFFPMYKINDTWFTGDTIQWDRIPTDWVDGDIVDANIKAVVVQTHHDSLLIWRTDPTSTTDIEGYPVWLDFKMMMSFNDSCLFSISAELGRQ